MRTTLRLATALPGRDGILEVHHSVMLGRAPSNNFVLPFHTVSRCHALIRRLTSTSGEFEILDLGSANGTYLDGVKVTGTPVRMPPRAIISIGEYKLIFETTGDRGPVNTHSRLGESVLVSELVVTLVCEPVYTPPRGADVPKAPPDWVRHVLAALMATEGLVERFVGDRVLSYWALTGAGATIVAGMTPVAGTSEGLAALQAARRILAASQSFPPLPDGSRFGVCLTLHTGMAALDRGVHPGKAAPSLIGTVTSEALALADGARRFGAGIHTTGFVLSCLPPDTQSRPLGDLRLVAGHEPVRVFTID